MYPKVSHAFIEREIRALRGHGVEVHTFSVRPVPDTEVLSAADRDERSRTPVLLASRAALMSAVLGLLVRHPRTLAGAVRQALASGPPTPRSKIWQLCYLAEAAVLVRHMSRLGARHLHVHLANNSADIARLATTLGSGATGRRWTWSLAMHGPTEFADVRGTDLAAKVRSARFVACISDFCRSQLMQIVEPEHWDKLQVVRMSVDPQSYPPMLAQRAERAEQTQGLPLRVLFVGRLVPEKGPMLLLDAVAALPPGRVELRIVGDGPLRDDLERAISRHGLGGSVTLTGAVGQDDLPAHYGWADVFCLPSVAEGLPVVLMEAMATGLPVVSTGIAGIPELIADGESGLIVLPGRAEAVTAALVRLQAPALREQLGRAAIEAVSSPHDARVNAKTLLTLLTKAG